MTLHYHGTPITPRSELLTLAGRCFCVSYAAPSDVDVCHEIGQSVMLDNGAFSFWRQGRPTDWTGYYSWVDQWVDRPTTWAVIPDVIDGTVADNDRLIAAWPFGQAGSPVWHMHESIERLQRLCDTYQRVCVGSSGEYATVGDSRWRRRMDEAFNRVVGSGSVANWFHMLRGMALSGQEYPFASVDSTDVARNHNREWNTALKLAARWDALQCPGSWRVREDTMRLDVAA